MEDDGGSGVLTFCGLAGNVESSHGTPPVPDLADFQGEKLANSQAGADTKGNEGAVAQGEPSLQICQRQFEFLGA